MFWLVGNALYLSNFKEIRRNIERECRQRHEDHEVFLEEIYEVVEQRYGVDKEAGMRKELELERAVCFAARIYGEVVRSCEAEADHRHQHGPARRAASRGEFPHAAMTWMRSYMFRVSKSAKKSAWRVKRKSCPDSLPVIP